MSVSTLACAVQQFFLNKYMSRLGCYLLEASFSLFFDGFFLFLKKFHVFFFHF